MKKRIVFPIVKVTTKVVVLKQVKVKAYTRTRFGKKEKVRSHLSGRRVAQTEFHHLLEIIPYVQHFDTCGSKGNLLVFLFLYRCIFLVIFEIIYEFKGRIRLE